MRRKPNCIYSNWKISDKMKPAVAALNVEN